MGDEEQAVFQASLESNCIPSPQTETMILCEVFSHVNSSHDHHHHYHHTTIIIICANNLIRHSP